MKVTIELDNGTTKVFERKYQALLFLQGLADAEDCLQEMDYFIEIDQAKIAQEHMDFLARKCEELRLDVISDDLTSYERDIWDTAIEALKKEYPDIVKEND